MSLLKSICLGLTAIGAAVVASETHLASLDVIKYIGTVCGTIYTIGRLTSIVFHWVNKELKTTIAEEIKKQMSGNKEKND